MSSLLQHHGGRSEDGRKVELLFYKDNDSLPLGQYEETYPGTNLPVLYRIFRRPVGLFGCWVVFRYLGEEQVPDLSVPIRTDRLPRGAERLTEEEGIAYWKS